MRMIAHIIAHRVAFTQFTEVGFIFRRANRFALQATMSKVTPYDGILEADGWFLTLKQWKTKYEPPPKPKPKPKELTEEQRQKKRQTTLRRINWLVDWLSKAIFLEVVALLPEIQAELLEAVSDTARKECGKMEDAKDAMFLEQVARLTNALAAMDATARLATTAEKKRKPTCCNPCKPYCAKYPAPASFHELRRSLAAPKVIDALQKLQEAAGLSSAEGADQAAAALGFVYDVAEKLASLMSAASTEAGDISAMVDKLTAKATAALSSPAFIGGVAALRRGALSRAKDAEASVEKGVTAAVTTQLIALLDVFGDPETATAAGKGLAESLVAMLRDAAVVVVRDTVVTLVASALFGGGELGKAAAKAVNLQQLAAAGTSAAGEANAKLGGVASGAPEAAERFRELSSELRELTVMTPDALADLYDADHERTVAMLKVQKDLLVEECKAALAKNV